MPDLTGWSVLFDIRPCLVHGDDIDPSTVFSVRDVRLHYMPDFHRKLVKDTGGGHKEFDQAMRDWRQLCSENNVTTPLITVIPIDLIYDEHMLSDSVPVFTPSHGAQLALATRMQDPNPSDYLRRWIPTLKAMVLRGHMLGPLDVKADEDIELRVGRMQRWGSIMVWVPLTDEEVQRAGYIEFPGVVGPVVQISNYGVS
ncbi:hypothetical protein EVG20_g7650 [Dentipellis fragilis]|uniref:Uncharacterized protein n=1 Tax=Dentipellis fragilis TaxID=205917 RepID=A0A4Y9YED6_9AGAM|nr:hypothetical protein EVG20_g7650 [Dentipellis fragilis]